MSKHTPGPWKCIEVEFGDYRTGDVAFVVSSESEPMRASVRNCILIAAAPELLGLLVESQTSIGGDWRERRDAAVAKATGSTS